MFPKKKVHENGEKTHGLSHMVGKKGEKNEKKRCRGKKKDQLTCNKIHKHFTLPTKHDMWKLAIKKFPPNIFKYPRCAYRWYSAIIVSTPSIGVRDLVREQLKQEQGLEFTKAWQMSFFFKFNSQTDFFLLETEI